MRGFTRSLLGLLTILLLAACADGSATSAAVGTAPPADGGQVDSVRYTCDAPPGFALGLLDQPADAETEDHPSAQALRAAIADPAIGQGMLPPTGWWLASRDERVAEYVARKPDAVADEPAFAQARFEWQGGGWKIVGWGDCRPQIVLDGMSLATWVLDPALPSPGPETTEIGALVTEQACTGAEPMGPRLQAPRITYMDDAVLVVFAAVPLEGDAFECPGNPSMRVVFELREPLGDRRLLDASRFPPVDASVPAP